ncbi:ATPase AAA [Bacteroidia bacterium]|nr:ATPase AAA [Bacteroidia bacterium]
MKNLPIGIQSFEKLRESDCLYVDKTEIIHRLITSGKVFFLSRPRRFGKSLLVSTLEAIFRGQKELFEGLWIEDKIDWTQLNHPVVRIDFGGINNKTTEDLKKDFENVILQIAHNYGITLTRTGAGSFAELITKMHTTTGQQVVVLIDEYDKAILDNITNMEVMEGNKNILHDFYQVLKATDEHLRFVFLTGVSKFSKVSIFSGLNSLRDITLNAQFATICGYTQTELEFYFDLYIDELAQEQECTKPEAIEKIKYWYDGYSWDGDSFVYNSFSTLVFFADKEFKDHWFATGSPTFIVNLLKEHNDIKSLLEPIHLPAEKFDGFDIQAIDPQMLMFQTGYLTIKKKEKNSFGEYRYTLGVPNEEVRRALTTNLFASYAVLHTSDTAMIRSQMMDELLEGNPQAFEGNLQALFAHIPYQLWSTDEKYYHSLLLLCLNMLGFKVEAEVSTDKGRIDAVWTWKERVVIAEVKYANKGKVEPLVKAALKQIHANKYYERYVGKEKRIALLAVAFTGKEIGCKIEEM